MQRSSQFLPFFIWIVLSLAYMMTNLSTCAEMIDSKSMNSEEMDKFSSEYALPNQGLADTIGGAMSLKATNNELVSEQFLKDVPSLKSSHIKWYLLLNKSFPNAKFAPILDQNLGRVATVGDRIFPIEYNRQFSKKQSHLKKNNPRDILRGLAVKRDRFV